MPSHTTPQPQDSRCTDHRLGSNFALDGLRTGERTKKKKDRRLTRIIIPISGVLTGQIEPIIQQCIALDEQEQIDELIINNLD